MLNFLTGELLRDSWKCVAEFGKLLEFGEHDMEAFGKPQMHTFLPNRSYICVNFGHLIKERPEKAGA